MANIIPNSFRGALFEANHNFKASGGNTFKFSLYTTNPYSVTSTVALLGTGNGEVDTTGGTNYVVKTLTRLGVVSATVVSSVDFDIKLRFLLYLIRKSQYLCIFFNVSRETMLSRYVVFIF